MQTEAVVPGDAGAHPAHTGCHLTLALTSKAPVLQNSWMTVATSEDHYYPQDRLQPPSHTRDLGGQRELLTAHGNLLCGPHASCPACSQAQPHCRMTLQVAENAGGKVVWGLGTGYWARGKGTRKSLQRHLKRGRCESGFIGKAGLSEGGNYLNSPTLCHNP